MTEKIIRIHNIKEIEFDIIDCAEKDDYDTPSFYYIKRIFITDINNKLQTLLLYSKNKELLKIKKLHH